MSNTVIILGSLFVNKMNFKRISALGRTLELVLIIDKEEQDLVSAEAMQYFKEVIIIKGGDTSTVNITLNYNAAQKTVQELIKSNTRNKISLITFNEFNVDIVGKLHDDLHLSGLSAAQAELFRNKELMKDRLEQQNIRAPRYASLDYEQIQHNISQYFDQLKETVGLPFIVKPCSAAGSFGVEKIENLEAFTSWYRNFGKEKTPYSIEEFIEGTFFHCDTAIKDGEIIFSECSEYAWPNLDFVKEAKVLASYHLPSKDPLSQKIIKFAGEVLSAMSMPDGVTHMELFLTQEGEIIFLEVGARPPGCDIVRMLECTTGVNLLNLHLEILSGLPIADFETEQISHAFWCFFPHVAGRVVDITLPKLQSEHTISWNVAVGDELQSAISARSQSGDLVVKNDDLKALMNDFETIKHCQPLSTVAA